MDPPASFPSFFASERALQPGPAGELRHDEACRRIRVEQVVPRGISSGVRPPRPTPPAKKQRPAASSRPTGPPPAAHPQPTAPPLGDGLRRRQEEPSRRPNAVLFPAGPPPCVPHASRFTEPPFHSSALDAVAAWDARSSASSPELGYDDNFFSTQMLDPMASSSQPWTSLLTQDNDVDLQLLASSDVTPNSGGKGSAKRGTNYTHEEDIQLCISWMNVSSDPVVGNEQPSKSYYQRIADDFHKNKEFESNRSTKSLEIRIAAIIKDCMKFQSCYEEIERRHPSGVPYQEHVMEAQARYSRASKGKTCQFLHCWLKVRHSEKFATVRMNVGGSKSAKSRDINLNVPAGSEQANDEGQEVGQGEAQPKAVRPPGRKKSKEKKRGEGDDEYMGMMKNFLEIKTQEHAMKKEMWANEKSKEIEDNRKLALEERKLDMEHQRLRWEQEKQIMFCDVTQMDEHQRAYVRVRRAELAKAALVNANVGETASGESFV